MWEVKALLTKDSRGNCCIVSFDLIERDKLRRYIENPYLYSRVQHTQTLPQEQRGLTIPAEMSSLFPKSSILWQKKADRYVTFLLREEVTEGFPNNLHEHLSHIQESHRTGAIISRFLLCAQENGKTYDFYKTFVEIIWKSNIYSNRESTDLLWMSFKKTEIQSKMESFGLWIIYINFSTALTVPVYRSHHMSEAS